MHSSIFTLNAFLKYVHLKLFVKKEAQTEEKNLNK
jgi:hypothetical protein